MGRPKHTYEEIKEYLNKLGYELISKEYINSKQKLIFKDKDGYYYCVIFYTLIKGSPPSKINKYNPYTIQNIKLWCKLNNKPFELISDTYERNDKSLKWKCLKEECGEEFENDWNCIDSQSQGCPFCRGLKVGLSNCLATKNPELAKEWHPTLNGDLTPFDVTCGCNKSVWWKCEKGHEWKVEIYNRVGNDSNCPYCSGRYPKNDYNLLVCNPELCKEWDYSKNDKKPEEYLPFSSEYVWWKCKECGHEWYVSIANRSAGNGCSQCNESKGEKKISEFCKTFNISHDTQYKFDDLRGIGGGLLKIDSLIFWDDEMTKIKIAIEYDGIQHFRPIKHFGGLEGFKKRIKNDIMKNLYCAKNNIKLIRIPYWEFDNIEKYLRYYLIDNNEFDY